MKDFYFFFSFGILWYCYPAAISYNIENSLIGLILRLIRLDSICLSTYSYNILESLLELTLIHMSAYLCILTCTHTYRCLNVLYLSFYMSVHVHSAYTQCMCLMSDRHVSLK